MQEDTQATKSLTKKGQQTKQRICDTAIPLIRERGYDNVSVSDICKAAGVSNGSFFHYYKTKDDVLVEFVRDESIRLEEYYESLDKSDAIEAFRNVMRWQAENYLYKGEEYIAHLHAHLIVNKHVVAIDYSLGRVLGKCIALGREQGVMHGGISPEELGRLILNDVLATTSFAVWPTDGQTVIDVLMDRTEVYLGLCGVKSEA